MVERSSKRRFQSAVVEPVSSTAAATAAESQQEIDDLTPLAFGPLDESIELPQVALSNQEEVDDAAAWPRDESDVQKVESSLARQLGNLSMKEHERILFDLHGVNTSDSDGETERASPSTQLLLEEMKKKIAAIPEKPAYERAKQLNPSYVESDSFLMLFLRSTQMDAKGAAEKIVAHFQVKSELFGWGELLARDIHQSDFDEHDMELVNSGVFRALPRKDLAGRTVMLVSLRRAEDVGPNEQRAQWYFYMALLRDLEASKNGLVFVLFHYNSSYRFSLPVMRKNRRVRHSLPIFIRAVHYCYDNWWLRPIVIGFKYLVEPNNANKFRIRDHFGSIQEAKFTLQTYGIIIGGTSGTDDTDDGFCFVQEELAPGIPPSHTKWVNDQLVFEQQQEAMAAGTNSTIDESKEAGPESDIVPTEFDVLFGKSKEAREHLGTVRCQMMVEMNWDRYESASRRAKTDVANEIVDLVHKSNGRFLKKEQLEDSDSSVWVEVDYAAAREKVSHFFRQRREQLAKSKGSSGTKDKASEKGSSSGIKRNLERDESPTSFS
uniref:DUF6824 domain-containing protein n=1 Tax=Entomoneis paludosa TaxID=265537 RepID=A0A7S2YLL2_9STRA|mmetsp:Transcript_37943/g.78817  ORF Transcript_37943/g.78817 Transcript_37943/m.78817 type:complete len:549 (+) Transcript_37943:58-1704(+)